MTEKHYGGGRSSGKKMTPSQYKKLICKLGKSYALGDKIRMYSEKEHENEKMQAEEELLSRLSTIS